MKYYLIAGEASGDLHAGNLMASLKEADCKAEFRYFGGDIMQKQGGKLVRHYKDTAFMGFIPVLLHLRQIFANMNLCKKDIVAWNPDVVILVDYPGFNLSIAKFLHKETSIPVYYYIAPKIWAWKEYRIKQIKRDISALFSILPFEVNYFQKKHQYQVHYVGNPSLDEISAYKNRNPYNLKRFQSQYNLDSRPVIALLAGSRKQEIKNNLPMMIQAALKHADRFQIVLAAAPGIDPEYYKLYVSDSRIHTIYNNTYDILQHAAVALVTSGTATLETALFEVPQVVCYYVKMGKIVSQLRKLFLKVPFVSLVNLIAGREIVPELIAGMMTSERLDRELANILPGGSKRKEQQAGYREMRRLLGSPGAPDKAASLIIKMLERNK